MKNLQIASLEELYRLSKYRLEGQHGQISINFANHNHVYRGNDVIGNCLQEWLPDWFSHLGVDIHEGAGTQVFPDFVATFSGISYDVEIKAWNINNAPAFDLANFYSFLDTTFQHPGKINAHYFILGYQPDRADDFAQGFTLKKLYLRHLWQITGPARKYRVGLQVKRGIPHALRPCNFHSRPQTCFAEKAAFLRAAAQAFAKFPNPIIPFTPVQWLEKVLRY